MKTYIFSFFLLFYSYTSWAESTTWKDECIGYYQLQLPDNLEVGLYPAENINTKDLPIDAIFGEYHQYRRGNINNPYSHFYYGKHRVLVSKNNVVSFNKYKDDVGEDLSYFNHKYNTIQYSHDVFFLSYDESYSLYIYKKNRLYQFMKGHDDIRLRTETKYLSSESGILSFLEHFQTRELYDIPSEKGFCLPYGFIANDSGAEDRDMAVTYRMNNHPDVMIVFQDASYQLPYKVPLNSDLTPVKNYDAKDYAKWLWNKVYMSYPGHRELLPPGWFSIEMDGRKGSGSFLQVTRKDGKKDYGYLAFVRADPKNSTQKPDLQVYVSSYSFLVTEEHPQISPDELKALAEHIVSSVKHR